MQDFQHQLEAANQMATLLGYLAPRMEPRKVIALVEYLGDLINPLVALFLKPVFILMEDEGLALGTQALKSKLEASALEIDLGLELTSMETEQVLSVAPGVEDAIADAVLGETPVEKGVEILLNGCDDPGTYVQFNAQFTLPYDLKFLPRLAVSRASVFLRAAEQVSPRQHALHYHLANILCQAYLKLSHFEGCLEESDRILQSQIPIKHEERTYLQILKGIALAGLGELTKAKDVLGKAESLAMKVEGSDSSALCLALSEIYRLGLSTGDMTDLPEVGALMAQHLDQCQAVNVEYTAVSFFAIWQSQLGEKKAADENSQYANEAAHTSRALDIEIDVRNQRVCMLLMQGRKQEAVHLLVENLTLLALSDNALVASQTEALIYQTTSRANPQLPEILPDDWQSLLPIAHQLSSINGIHIVSGRARQRALNDSREAAQQLVPVVRVCEQIRQVIPDEQIRRFLINFIEVYRLFLDLPTHDCMPAEEFTSILGALIVLFENAEVQQDEYLARALLQLHFARSAQKLEGVSMIRKLTLAADLDPENAHTRSEASTAGEHSDQLDHIQTEIKLPDDVLSQTASQEPESEINIFSQNNHYHRLSVGELIEDRYIVKEVRTGGMAVVYIVQDQKRPMRLAVKSLRPELPLSLQGVRRFLSEANIWANLGEHPHIVQVMSVSRFSESNPLIFLEYVDSETLRELMNRAGGQLPLVQMLDLAIQCCAGMQYVQSKGVIHRDLKPDNLLITREGVLKVTDFGISRAFREDFHSDQAEKDPPLNARLTSVGVALGTLPYMSPEQLAGDANTGPASDIFSFGVVLYELMTGELPFRGETPSEIIASQTLRPRPPSELLVNRSFPSELDSVVMACLAVVPPARPSDFGILEQALIEVYESVVKTEEKSQPSTKLPKIQYAVELLNQRRWRDAIPLLDSIIGSNPRDFDAWHNKGNALMDLAEEFELNPLVVTGPKSEPDLLKMTECSRSAIRCAERAIELYPQHDLAWNTKGGCLIRIGYFHRALSCLNQAITINNRYPAAWRNRSTCLRRLGRLEEALVSYQVALALEPRNPNALNGLGVCLALLKRYEEALDHFAQALEIAPHHIQATANQKLWQSIAADDPNLAVVVGAHQPDVEDHLHEVLDSPVHHGRVPRDQEADELGNRAWGLMNLGLLAEALNVINQALDIDPKYTTALLHKGRILRRMKRLEEAVETFSFALEIDPSDLVRLNRGLALSDLCRYEEAVSDYKVYLLTEPEDTAVWINLGFCCTQQCDLKSAVENFARALEIDPEHHQALIGKSQVHLLLGEFEEAEGYCRKAISNDPINAAAWLIAGQIAQRRSNLQEALKAYAHVIEIAPQNPNGWELGALCLNLLQGPPEIVLEWCARAQALDVTPSPSLSVTRASALYRCERYAEAFEAYDALLQLEPSDEPLQNLKSLCLLKMEQGGSG